MSSKPPVPKASFVVTPELIVAAIGAIGELIRFITNVKQTNEQTAGWTPEQRAAVDAKWNELMSSPAWQTDKDKGL